MFDRFISIVLIVVGLFAAVFTGSRIAVRQLSADESAELLAHGQPCTGGGPVLSTKG